MKPRIFLTIVLLCTSILIGLAMPTTSSINLNYVDLGSNYEVQGDIDNLHLIVNNLELQTNNIQSTNNNVTVNFGIDHSSTDSTINKTYSYNTKKSTKIQDSFAINLVGNNAFSSEEFLSKEKKIDINISINHPDIDGKTISRTVNINHTSLPSSCQKILSSNPDATSGIYEIGNDNIEVYCDMDTDGGGWTGINTTVAKQLVDNNTGGITTYGSIRDSGYSGDTNRPYYWNNEDGGMRYDVPIPGNYTEFYVTMRFQPTAYRSSDTSEIDAGRYVMDSWSETTGYDCVGDIGLGASSENGPATSYAGEGSSHNSASSITKYPTESIFSVTEDDVFRIQMTENCGQNEGWMWYDGRVFVR